MASGIIFRQSGTVWGIIKDCKTAAEATDILTARTLEKMRVQTPGDYHPDNLNIIVTMVEPEAIEASPTTYSPHQTIVPHPDDVVGEPFYNEMILWPLKYLDRSRSRCHGKAMSLLTTAAFLGLSERIAQRKFCFLRCSRWGCPLQ